MPPKYDEYGNPIPPTMWDQDQPMNSGGFGGAAPDYSSQLGSPQELAQSQGAESGITDYSAPSTPAPISSNPRLAAANIKTTGPQADQAAQNAQNYDPSLYEEQGQVRNTPQQYGQAGDVYNPDEGPLSPQDAAERMPTEPDAMTKLLDQHLLHAPPKASADGYQNYVTASREKRAAEKDQLRQQGALNRADAASKDARVTAQMGGFNPYSWAQSQGMLPGGGNDRVSRNGGYTFVRGTMRPQDSQEQAHTNLTNAQADYTRQRGDESAKFEHDLERARILAQGGVDKATIGAGARTTAAETTAAGGVERAQIGADQRSNTAADRLAQGADQFSQGLAFKKQQQKALEAYRIDRLSAVNAANQRLEDAAAASDVNKTQKLALDAQAALDRTIGELKAREGGSRTDQSIANKWLGIGKNPQQLKDRIYDKSGKPGAILEGSYGVLADEAIRYADMLANAHDKAPGGIIPPPSPDQAAFLKKLRAERGTTAPEAVAGAQ